MALHLPIFVIILVLLYQFFTRTFNYWRKRNVKGPRPIPLFGNLFEVAFRRKHVGVIYKEIYDVFPDEKIVGIYRMTTPSLLIRDLDVVKKILVKDFDCFSERGIGISSDQLGDNLFHCDTDTWRALRTYLTPAFTSGKLRSVFPALVDRGNKFVDYIESVSEKKQDFDAYGLTMRYTIATIMTACFGLNIDTFKDDNELLEDIDRRIFTPSYWIEMDMLFPGFVKKFNVSIFSEVVNKFCHEISDIVSKQRNGLPEQCNLADILMNLKAKCEMKSQSCDDKSKVTLGVTNNMIASQIFIFFAAGYGNTTLALLYALSYLAEDFVMQDRLISEIDEVLERYDGQLTYDGLNEMKYLEMVFYETLRMHPLTNSIARIAKQDYKIEETDVILNKGTTIVISPYAIQHDEKNYPNPEKFDPERFSPDNVGARHSCAYLAFGVGPRGCLGLRFAKIQFGLCIVQLLSKFRVVPSERTMDLKKYNPRRTLLIPQDGVYLNFVRRNKYNW